MVSLAQYPAWAQHYFMSMLSTITFNSWGFIIRNNGNSEGVWCPVLSHEGHQHEWIPSDRSHSFSRSYVFERFEDIPFDDEISLSENAAKGRTRALPRGSLPGELGFYHVLINRERVCRGLRPLERTRFLDEVALSHAEAMALEGRIEHSNVGKLIPKVLSFSSSPCRRIGENVLNGRSPEYVHQCMMLAHSADRNNILDRRYISFGVGISIRNEEIYICQLFKG